MSPPRRIIAPPGDVRLDQLLVAELPGYSRAQVRELLQQGRVRVAGTVVRTGRRIAAGTLIEVQAATGEVPLASAGLPLAVVFANSAVVVVDKPAGMPTLPLAPHEEHTLANALVARYPELRHVSDRPLEAGLLHRLDNDTSGLLVAARTPEAYRAFASQFAAGEVVKTYLALVHGHPAPAQVIELPLAHDPSRPEAMLAVADPVRQQALAARPARSEVRMAARHGDLSLVEVVIHKGARHQIRAHLAAVGHPVAGDRLYGDPTLPRPAPRHFLHAWRLRLRHPVSGEPIDFEAPLPGELTDWLGVA